MPRLRYLANPYLAGDPAGHCREVNLEWIKTQARHYVNRLSEQRLSADNTDGGIYVGLAGIGYGFLRATRLFPESTEKLTSLAKQYCDFHLKTNPSRSRLDESQFLLGGLGISVIQLLNPSCRDRAGLIDRINQLVDTVLPVDYQRNGGDEMLVGRAGFLAAILTIRHALGESLVPDDRIRLIIASMLQSGRAYASKHRSPCPLMYRYHGTEYLGAAHGLCAILQMMLSFPNCLDATDERDIRTCVDWFAGLQTASGNFPCATDEIGRDRGEDDLVHWCHGAPGAIYLMAFAYLKWKESRYLQICERSAALIWQRGLLLKGPGICHGVAGNAYAFLLMYRITGREQFLNQARCFARVMCSEEFLARARTPDSPNSLFEGIAGSLCFLVDLAHPDQAQFPMFPLALLP